MTTTTAQPGDIFCDCAVPLSAAVLSASRDFGVKGWMKYVRYDNAIRGKYGSAAEAELVWSFGMYYMMNWEIQGDRALQGYPVGRSDGSRSRTWLRSIGYPEDVSAPVSVDQNTDFGNGNTVAGFVRGHWETDGDRCMNISYLDKDGTELIARQNPELDPHNWLPGAMSWSPGFYSEWKAIQARYSKLWDRYRAMADRAMVLSPTAVAIQFPSTEAFGIHVDFNLVLRPFNVWGARREVHVDPPVIVQPPVEVQPETPVVSVPKEDKLATARITVEGRNAQFYGTGTLLPDGSVHCVVVTWSGPGEESFHQDHSAAPDVVHQHYMPETLQRDLVLIGNPAEIQDSLHSWNDGDFYRVVK